MAGNVWEWVNDYYRPTIMILFQSGKVTKTLRDLTLVMILRIQYRREFIEEVLFYVQMNIVQDTWWDLEEVEERNLLLIILVLGVLNK
jgi:hypothetical protein